MTMGCVGGGFAEIIHDIVEMIGELWTELDEEAAEPFFIEEKELSYPSSGGVAKVCHALIKFLFLQSVLIG